MSTEEMVDLEVLPQIERIMSQEFQMVVMAAKEEVYFSKVSPE